jgi:hypothetical protein
MSKFPVNVPDTLGNFPAYALIFRRGDVREAPDALHSALALEDLFRLKGSGAFAAQALDALRAAEVRGPAAAPSVDPLAFFVGRVARTIDGDSARAREAALGAYVDRAAGTVRSLTGELAWDYGRGVVTLDAPRAQGFAGFLGQAPRWAAGAFAVECRNEYATVVAVSLDGAPLAAARRVLVQAMTTARPHGFRAEGGRIASLGTWPWGVELLRARATLAGGSWRGAAVTALDENGDARAGGPAAEVAADGAAVAFPLLEDSVYYIVSR